MSRLTVRKTSSTSSPYTGNDLIPNKTRLEKTLSTPSHATLLINAISREDASEVRGVILTPEGASCVNAIQTYQGWAPFHYACREGNVEICQMLLDHGADVNLPSLNGQCTPLKLAYEFSHFDLAKLLMFLGACDQRVVDGRPTI